MILCKQRLCKEETFHCGVGHTSSFSVLCLKKTICAWSQNRARSVCAFEHVVANCHCGPNRYYFSEGQVLTLTWSVAWTTGKEGFIEKEALLRILS